jgi:hypothetical protein
MAVISTAFVVFHIYFSLLRRQMVTPQKFVLPNHYKFVMWVRRWINRCVVTAVDEVDRPQPGGAGCGFFLPELRRWGGRASKSPSNSPPRSGI